MIWVDFYSSHLQKSLCVAIDYQADSIVRALQEWSVHDVLCSCPLSLQDRVHKWLYSSLNNTRQYACVRPLVRYHLLQFDPDTPHSLTPRPPPSSPCADTQGVAWISSLPLTFLIQRQFLIYSNSSPRNTVLSCAHPAVSNPSEL